MTRKDWRIFLLTALLIAAFPWMVQPVKAVSHYVDVMVFAGIFALVCLGVTMLMGYAGQVSMAQAAFLASVRTPPRSSPAVLPWTPGWRCRRGRAWPPWWLG